MNIGTVREEYITRYQQEPIRWVNEVLGIDLWEKQDQVLNSIFQNRRTVVPSGHGVGKTFVSAGGALAFLYIFSPSIVLTTAPTWTQVESVLWEEIRSLYINAKVPLGGELLKTQIHCGEKWYARGISTDKPERFQGFHEVNILVIVDEAPGVDRTIHQAVDSLLTTFNAHCLMIGNPTSPSGFFYDACRSTFWNKIHISCLESPNVKADKIIIPGLVTQEWVEEKKEEWGEESPLYQSRVLGEFPEEGEDTLIPLSWVERATRREPIFGERRIGCDVARYGTDLTVFIQIQGNRAEILDSYLKKSTMHTAGKSISLIREKEPEVFSIDDTGVGGGVTDRLKEQEIKVNPINFGEKAMESDKFFNRRSELWWNLREWIRDKASLPNFDKLVQDLTSPKYEMTSKGQIKIESKDGIKKRLGRSPDFGDALALALAIPKKLMDEFIIVDL